MIDRDPPVTEDELHAYVDGELPADRHRAVEAWLASHPEDMARVALWRAQMDEIRARYGGAFDEPRPARFDIERLSIPSRPWRIAAAAALVAFVVGGASGWFARNAVEGIAAAPRDFESFTADAIDAYNLYVVEVRHPVEVTAADADHLVQWLSKRVGYQLHAPNLEKLGLKLVGGRLLPGPTGAAAFFMYEAASGQRYTLYCARSTAPETALRYNNIGKATAVYWVSSDVAYVVSGEGDRARLHNVAVAAYEQLDTRGGQKERGS